MPSVLPETMTVRVTKLTNVVQQKLDANRYATKKTIAQGMLDIALLTANASELKYLLSVGSKHEFYIPLLVLIIMSIILQIVKGILAVFLGTSLNINNEKQQNSANLANNIFLSLSIATVAVNVVISVFDMRDTNSIKPGLDQLSNHL